MGEEKKADGRKAGQTRKSCKTRQSGETRQSGPTVKPVAPVGYEYVWKD
jgi:hypothetical protein